MKITFLICLTALGIAWIVCRAWIERDYQKTEQVLSHLDGTSMLVPRSFEK